MEKKNSFNTELIVLTVRTTVHKKKIYSAHFENVLFNFFCPYERRNNIYYLFRTVRVNVQIYTYNLNELRHPKLWADRLEFPTDHPLEK